MSYNSVASSYVLENIRKHEDIILPLVSMFEGELVYFRTEETGDKYWGEDEGYLIKFLYDKELTDYQISTISDFFAFDVIYRPKGYNRNSKITNKGPYTFIKKNENIIGSTLLEVLITIREDLDDVPTRLNIKIIPYQIENKVVSLKIIP